MPPKLSASYPDARQLLSDAFIDLIQSAMTEVETPTVNARQHTRICEVSSESALHRKIRTGSECSLNRSHLKIYIFATLPGPHLSHYPFPLTLLHQLANDTVGLETVPCTLQRVSRVTSVVVRDIGLTSP